MVSVQQWFAGSMVHCHTNIHNKKNKRNKKESRNRRQGIRHQSGITKETKKKKKKNRLVYKQWYIRQKCRHLLNMRQKPTERFKNPNQVTINERNDHFSLIHFIISITLLP
ncbi:uncharacterized protein ASPGLDRAFT_405401 [Aspergillus glaucus CBS 516.65]|uniref:Uncharacterized protein n=1 Tax=Aspergillus glaucus CBS 516.65 TaxID=1160497 RepID=A0A1L9VHV3_ASPGL|nr:hypothetical protein ASPGLDRAFT_405401 [Aspergillus glaucus CBS 516.65]OJJ83474.1 hypothetical protein ASPGLDRAFT_405401 [Aspergillus glaucus CBS 516.65]